MAIKKKVMVVAKEKNTNRSRRSEYRPSRFLQVFRNRIERRDNKVYYALNRALINRREKEVYRETKMDAKRRPGTNNE